MAYNPCDDPFKRRELTCELHPVVQDSVHCNTCDYNLTKRRVDRECSEISRCIIDLANEAHANGSSASSSHRDLVRQLYVERQERASRAYLEAGMRDMERVFGYGYTSGVPDDVFEWETAHADEYPLKSTKKRDSDHSAGLGSNTVRPEMIVEEVDAHGQVETCLMVIAVAVTIRTALTIGTAILVLIVIKKAAQEKDMEAAIVTRVANKSAKCSEKTFRPGITLLLHFGAFPSLIVP